MGTKKIDASLSITGALSGVTTLGASGLATVGSLAAGVGGFSGLLSANAGLAVTGAATISTTLGVTGTLTGAAATFSGLLSATSHIFNGVGSHTTGNTEILADGAGGNCSIYVPVAKALNTYVADAQLFSLGSQRGSAASGAWALGQYGAGSGSAAGAGFYSDGSILRGNVPSGNFHNNAIGGNSAFFVGRGMNATNVNAFSLGTFGVSATSTPNTAAPGVASDGSSVYYNSASAGSHFFSGGSLAITGTTATDGPTLGANLLGSTGWTSTGWTGSAGGPYTNTVTNITPLTNSLAATTGTGYIVGFVVTGASAGSFTITFGGVTSAAFAASGSWGPTALTTGSFSITPTASFNGTVAASIQAITSSSSATLTLKSSDSATRFEARGNIAASSTYLGVSAGRYASSVAIYNTALGVSSLYRLTTGASNTVVGAASLLSLDTGSYNTALGVLAGSVNTLLTLSNCTFLGYQATSSVDGITNSTAIGNAAQVTASNQVVIGNVSVTATTLQGAVTGPNSLGFTQALVNTLAATNAYILCDTAGNLNYNVKSLGGHFFTINNVNAGWFLSGSTGVAPRLCPVANGALTIDLNTSAGSDTQTMSIVGGGGNLTDATRGGMIRISGLNSATSPGMVMLQTSQVPIAAGATQQFDALSSTNFAVYNLHDSGGNIIEVTVNGSSGVVAISRTILGSSTAYALTSTPSSSQIGIFVASGALKIKNGTASSVTLGLVGVSKF